ncbi:hypothetical protein A7975_18795 [Bacillus sp. FJAT-26390]|nr:hypothetical protein A7975_18795 [Bacillus sp. FJAT-26390]
MFELKTYLAKSRKGIRLEFGTDIKVYGRVYKYEREKLHMDMDDDTSSIALNSVSFISLSANMIK